MKRKRLLIFIPIIFVLAFLLTAFLWASDYYRASEDAAAVFNATSNVEITKDKYITFSPKDKQPTTGFIFYPGGKVAPDAYAPLCSRIAERGFKVVIVPMPLNLAVLGLNKAKDVEAAYPEIKNWAIGGHSLGGVMAADFAYKHISDIKGLILYAAYPQDKDDISKTTVKVLSLWGSQDGCADITKITGAKRLFPSDAELKPIEGGNHCQFGSYGFQKGDNPANISALEQQSQAVQYTVGFLNNLSK